MATNLRAPVGSADWFSLDGEAFVRQAYQRLLDRPADDNGLQNYTAQLMAGMTKTQLVAELESSPEGRLVARRRGIAARSYPDSARGSVSAGTVASTAAVPAQAGELFKLHGTAFVRSAYLALFKREADPEGLAHYTTMLRSGYSRSHVLQALAASPEAREKSSDLPGLKSLLASYRKAQARSWSGWYWRNVKGAESDLPAARESRMLCWRNESNHG